MDQSPPRRRYLRAARPRLVLGGLAVAAAGVSLGGCDSPPDLQDANFTTVAACTAAGYSQELCEAGYNAASAEHQRNAPQFNSLRSCEDDWGTGSCQPLAGGASGAGMSSGQVFVPFLAGFMLSRAMQQRYYNTGQVGYYGGGSGYRGSPIYRGRGGNTVTLDRSGGVARSTPVNVNTRTVSASGFGGMGMSRGSYGG